MGGAMIEFEGDAVGGRVRGRVRGRGQSLMLQSVWRFVASTCARTAKVRRAQAPACTRGVFAVSA
jgi:hypothetical protein